MALFYLCAESQSETASEAGSQSLDWSLCSTGSQAHDYDTDKSDRSPEESSSYGK